MTTEGIMAISQRPPTLRVLHPSSPAMDGRRHPPADGDNPKKQMKDRTAAIVAVVAYCHIQEPGKTNLQPKAKPITRSLMIVMPPNLQLQEEIRMRQSITVECEGRRLLAYYMCVGKLQRRNPDDLELADLCHQYASLAFLSRHYHMKHMEYILPRTRRTCLRVQSVSPLLCSKVFSTSGAMPR